jgi:hypothetical protein
MHEFSPVYSVWIFLALAVLLVSALLPVAFKIMTYLDNREKKALDGGGNSNGDAFAEKKSSEF